MQILQQLLAVPRLPDTLLREKRTSDARRYRGARVSSKRVNRAHSHHEWKASRTRKWPLTCANAREYELFADGVHLNINGRARSRAM